MPVTVGTTALTYNDSTVQNSSLGVAKAWLFYNSDSQTVLGSYNVSSVTYSGAGDYVLNYTTALSSANCSVLAMPGYYGSLNTARAMALGTFPAPSTTQCNVVFVWDGNASDPDRVCVTVFGT